MIAIRLAPTPPSEWKHEQPKGECPTRCQTLIHAPVQGLTEHLVYCIDCHRIYAAVPVARFTSEYTWQPVVKAPATASAILQFRRGA